VTGGGSDAGHGKSRLIENSSAVRAKTPPTDWA